MLAGVSQGLYATDGTTEGKLLCKRSLEYRVSYKSSGEVEGEYAVSISNAGSATRARSEFNGPNQGRMLCWMHNDADLAQCAVSGGSP